MLPIIALDVLIHPLSISPTKSWRGPALLRSPHADNVKADYILPVPSHTRQHLSAQARSSTLIPAYEPPSERFTPPRGVLRYSPRVSRSSKRKKILAFLFHRLQMTLSCFMVACDIHGRQSQLTCVKPRCSRAHPPVWENNVSAQTLHTRFLPSSHIL